MQEPKLDAPNLSRGHRQTLATTLFFLVHSLAVLTTARPVNLFYPSPPYDSGWRLLADIERTLQAPFQRQGPLGVYIRYLGVDQQWNTFAPVPPPMFAHYSVTAQTSKETKQIWTDGITLDRSGAGFHYNPMVKLTGMFGQPRPAFEDAFLRYQVKAFQQRGGEPPLSVSLETSYVTFVIDERGRISLKGDPQNLILRTLYASPP